MTKPYTPGPWTIERMPDDAVGMRLLRGPFLIRGSDATVVAELFHPNSNSDAGANARLVAKAPDMVAFLKDFLAGQHDYETARRLLRELGE